MMVGCFADMWTRRLGLFLLLAVIAHAGQPEPPGQVTDGKAVHEAYLFAHMMHGDYGRL